MELQDAGRREAGYGQAGRQDAETRGCGVWGWAVGAADAGCRETGTLGTGLCCGAAGDKIASPDKGAPAAPQALSPHFPAVPQCWDSGTALLGLPFPRPFFPVASGTPLRRETSEGALPGPRAPSPRVPPRRLQCRVAEPVSQSVAFPLQASRGKR